MVLEGERRLTAAKMTKLTHVPVIVGDGKLGDAEVIYRQLVVNESREPLNPIEKSHAINRYMNAAGLTASQVAVKLGISPGMVSKLLAIRGLPEGLQAKIACGKLALTIAYELTRTKDVERQHQLAEQVANGGLTREAVVAQRKQSKPTKSSPRKRAKKKNSKKRVNIPLGGGRSVAVSDPDLTVASVIDWLVELLERLRRAKDENEELPEVAKQVATKA